MVSSTINFLAPAPADIHGFSQVSKSTRTATPYGVWGPSISSLTVTIPSCIAPGDYLFRGELMIALHAASSYPRCAALHGIPPPPVLLFPLKTLTRFERSVPGSTSRVEAALLPSPTTFLEYTLAMAPESPSAFVNPPSHPPSKHI